MEAEGQKSSSRPDTAAANTAPAVVAAEPTAAAAPADAGVTAPAAPIPQPTAAPAPITSGLGKAQIRAKNRKIIAEDPQWNLACVQKLSQLCVSVVVKNFEAMPALHGIPAKYREQVLSDISLKIPLKRTAPLIPDDTYWKRKALASFKNCDILRHGGTWKEFFFENHIQLKIEQFTPGVNDELELIREIKLAAPFVTRLKITQLIPAALSAPQKATDPPPDHLLLENFVDELTRLKSLDLYYGVKDCGMNFTWTSFGMTIPDCKSLSRALKSHSSLESLSICRSRIDNERVIRLVSALMDNKLIRNIDFSHNAIGDIGANEFAKLLAVPTSPLSSLNLGNNKIRHPGAQALGRALANNTQLRRLDLRLNMIGDKGGSSLLNNLMANNTLTHLNIACNDLGPACVTALGKLLRRPDKGLVSVDVSSNRLAGVDDPAMPGKELYESLKKNKIVTDFDVRNTDVTEDIVAAIRIITNENRMAVY